jgi:hypothetical protein
MTLALALLAAGLVFAVSASADDAHPITLTVACDPAPELEGDGTIPELLFTIRNESQSDYTLEKPKLSGGYENVEMPLGDSITVLAGGTKEFTLSDVPVRADQLDVDVAYLLSWVETETIIDEETGDASFIPHARETTASMRIERFVVPELFVSASCDKQRVRGNEEFTVVYTIRNDTQFDMTGLKLYDPEQSMQSIPLPATELDAGQGFTVSVPYTMGAKDMTFSPRIEYVARRREMVTDAQSPLIVESVVVDLIVSAQQNPATEDGTTFIISVKNNGNRTVTGIRLYDEINTPIGQSFDLSPDQIIVRQYTVVPAISSDRIRTVRFHVEATDALDAPLYAEDPNAYTVLPYVTSDEVRLGLYVVLQSPYYDESGKLCATIQCEIRNYSELKIRNAKLNELTLFGTVTSYSELRHGETYFTRSYQLDGVQELRFRLDAVDPAGQPCSSETVRLDLTDLRAIADQKTDPVYVYTVNPYLQDLGAKYRDGMKTVAIVTLCVAGLCAAVCMALFGVELHLKNKLPAQFEEDLEKSVRTTKRRTEKQLFTDAPTVQFGYTAPIKLRNYGELTEEEAKARREQYARGLEENLKREGVHPSGKPAVPPKPVRIESDGTRVLPPKQQRPADGETAAFQRPGSQNAPDAQSKQTGEFRRPKPAAAPIEETAAYPRPKQPVEETAAYTRPKQPVEETAAYQRPKQPVEETAAYQRPKQPTEETAAFTPVKPKEETAPFRRPVSFDQEPTRPAKQEPERIEETAAFTPVKPKEETAPFRRPVSFDQEPTHLAKQEPERIEETAAFTPVKPKEEPAPFRRPTSFDDTPVQETAAFRLPSFLHAAPVAAPIPVPVPSPLVPESRVHADIPKETATHEAPPEPEISPLSPEASPQEEVSAAAPVPAPCPPLTPERQDETSLSPDEGDGDEQEACDGSAAAEQSEAVTPMNEAEEANAADTGSSPCAGEPIIAEEQEPLRPALRRMAILPREARRPIEPLPIRRICG